MRFCPYTGCLYSDPDARRLLWDERQRHLQREEPQRQRLPVGGLPGVGGHCERGAGGRFIDMLEFRV